MMKCAVYSYLTGRSGITNNILWVLTIPNIIVNVRNDLHLIELCVPPMLPIIIVSVPYELPWPQLAYDNHMVINALSVITTLVCKWCVVRRTYVVLQLQPRTLLSIDVYYVCGKGGMYFQFENNPSPSTPYIQIS